MALSARLPHPSWRLKAGAGAALFLAFFALYCAGHSASIYLDDSGETVCDAALLGVAHPPGYPLHTLLARLGLKAAGLLGGLGGPAEPVTLLAALFGALCVAALFWSASGPWLARLLPALLLGLGPVFWHNALTAKGGIYQLNNLLSVLLLGLLALPGPLGTRRRRLFWLLFGAALAHHYMSQLPLLPAYAWLLRGKGAWRASLKDAWLALPGLGLYLYMPLRSAQDPGLNWGGIHDLKSFFFFFFRLQYATTDLSRSPATSWSECRYALGCLLCEGSFALLPLGLLGLWAGRKEAAARAYALGWLATLAACSFYMNLKPDRLSLLKAYLFPAYLCQALLAARGLEALAARPGWGKVRRWALPAVLAACLALAWARLPALDLSDYYSALDNARGLLQTLPQDALLLCQGDAVVFPLWYAQRVLDLRPDVAVVGLPVLPMEWVRRDVMRRWPDLSEPMPDHPLGAESVGPLARATLDLNPQRPAYATFDRFEPPVPTWTLEPAGPDYRCVSAQFPAKPDPAQAEAARREALRLLESMPLRGVARRPQDPDTLRYLVGDLCIRYNDVGVEAEDAGAYAEARYCYATAAALKPGDPVFSYNLGNACYEQGDLLASQEAFQRSVQADPTYINAWFNRGLVLIRLARLQEARACLERVLQLDPKRTDAQAALRQTGVNLWPGAHPGPP